jgi:hypothetical protein
MRSRTTRIIRLVALGLIAGATVAPAAPATTPEHECAAWAQRLKVELAQYGIVGAQADSYIAGRADDPCHRPLTLRSLFHAGDPGTV